MSTPTFTITNHLYRRAATANRVVLYLATDVLTPGSVGGVSRELLASHVDALGVGETLELAAMPFTGGRVDDPRVPVTVTRNLHAAIDLPPISAPVSIECEEV